MSILPNKANSRISVMRQLPFFGGWRASKTPRDRVWILDAGVWNDKGVWIDDRFWKDS